MGFGVGCWVFGLMRQGLQVYADRFAAPMRSSAARAALRSTSPLPHLFRANYSCAIGARTLGAWLEID